MPLAAKKITSLSIQATLADGDLLPAFDVSAESLATMNVAFELGTLADWILDKVELVSEEEAEAGSGCTSRCVRV